MQPVQYRGYAQGTAFNPVVLSDRSQKILEQNEQFLRGLQEQQKIERNVELAKLKQLKENIESQRQQLNENFDYDNRQRQSYNQSLQANAAREVEQLKRAVAANPKKPNAAAVVNDLANFLVSTSESAGKIVGAIRQQRYDNDTVALQRIKQAGKLDDLVKGKIGSDLNYSILDQTEIDTQGVSAAFEANGNTFEAGEYLSKITPSLQARGRLLQVGGALQGFEQKYFAGLKGDELLRKPEEQSAAAKEEINKILQPLLDSGYNEESLVPIRELAGKELNKIEGRLFKQKYELNKTELVQVRQEMLRQDPTATNFSKYRQSLNLHHNGDKVKAYADFEREITDPDRYTDDQVRNYYKTTLDDQLGPGQVQELRFDGQLDFILDKRKQNKANQANTFFRDREITDKQTAEKLTRKIDELRADGTITDDEGTQQEFADLGSHYEAMGMPEAAKAARSAIKATQSYQFQQEQINTLQKLADNYQLTMPAINASGLVGDSRKKFVDLFEQQRSDYEPTEAEMSRFKTYTRSALTQQIYAGNAPRDSQDFQTTEFQDAEDFAIATARVDYINKMYESGGNRTVAAKYIREVLQGDLGSDPTQGLYRVAGDLKTIQENAKAGTPTTFNNPLIITAARERVYEVGGNARQAIVKQVVTFKSSNPGVDPAMVLPSIVSENQFDNTVRVLNTTGAVVTNPRLETATNELKMDYIDGLNYLAKHYGKKGPVIPKEVEQPVRQANDAARTTQFGKFLYTSGLNKPVISAGVSAELQTGGIQPWNPTVNPQNASPTILKSQLNYSNISNPVGKALAEMAQRNGWDPSDIAAIIGRETDNFDVNRQGVGAAAGRIGWFQAGENERKTYGLGSGDPYKEILAMERYLLDRGAKPGHGIADLYSAVNNGRAYLGWEPDGNGVIPRSPQNIRELEKYRLPGIQYFGFN